MMALIREFGFVVPLLILSSGEVIDGHLRLKAALKLGLREVLVIVCDHWSPEQVEAARLAINRSATWATFDPKLVSDLMKDLSRMNFDLAQTGFDPFEVDSFLSIKHDLDPRVESIPDLLKQPVTVAGDLWHCGAHRVLCGDATCAAAVARLLQSAQPLLMVTDPPYGTRYDPQWRDRAGLGRQRQTGKVTNDDRVDWAAAYRLFPGDAIYVWHAGVHSAAVAHSIEEAGWEIRSQIIWVKPHFVMSRGDYHWSHEPCYYAVRRGKTSHWRGDRKQCTVWEVPNLNPFGGSRTEMPTGHGTQKPVELMRRSILNHLDRGQALYDPFLGSGTTLIAAEVTGRVCYGLEIEPAYVDLTVRRWQELTGEKAVLDGDGRTYEQVHTERQANPAAQIDVIGAEES